MKKLVLIILVFLTLTACSAKNSDSSLDFFAMDTYMSISVTAENPQEIIDKSFEIINKIEKSISRTDSQSDIYKLNHSNGDVVVVSDITYEILELATEYAEATNGAFDPSICAVTDLWGIGSENARVPSDEELSLALKTVSYKNIILLENNQVQLLNGANIDLGGIGKGYAADKIAEIYEEYEAVYGVISLAGNIYVYGEKQDNSLWNIGITDPDNTNKIAMSLKTEQTSIVTTGAYERFFEQDGIIYHHIFDTSTGYPTTKDIKSVTIISENSAMADVYATALFTLPYEKAITVAESTDEIDVILINENNTVYISDGLNVALGENYEN